VGEGVVVKIPSWVILAVCCMLAGCGKKAAPEEKVPQGDTWLRQVKALTPAQVVGNPEILDARLRKTNPGYTHGALVAVDPSLGLAGQINVKTVSDLSGLRGVPFAALDLRGLPVSDIRPLQGMPLVMLGIEGTRVVDLGPLKRAKLKKLYLNNTGVVDLSPLKDMPIEEFMLVNTKVEDISPLSGMPLKMLWLNNTPVSDIRPIAGCPLLSLTLEGTKVIDLSPLTAHPTLRRLHIGNTKVTDLSPIRDLNLVRLIFTPSSITNGIGAARSMGSLQEIGTTLEGRMRPEDFWARYTKPQP